jgi:hypothetical protein
VRLRSDRPQLPGDLVPATERWRSPNGGAPPDVGAPESAIGPCRQLPPEVHNGRPPSFGTEVDGSDDSFHLAVPHKDVLLGRTGFAQNAGSETPAALGSPERRELNQTGVGGLEAACAEVKGAQFGAEVDVKPFATGPHLRGTCPGTNRGNERWGVSVTSPAALRLDGPQHRRRNAILTSR